MFRDTQVNCPVLPAALSPCGERMIMEPAPGVARGILSRHALVCPFEWKSTVRPFGASLATVFEQD